MIACTNATCNFWVHVHVYSGKELNQDSLCPFCESLLKQIYPEDIKWADEHLRLTHQIALDGRQFIDQRSGKVKILTVKRYAKENSLPEEIVMNIAKQHCRQCKKN